ncbi:MAG: hypothetical protein IT377_25725 [Polyangiaceae bacterium]|nr:hypothetical protein [Polyangiaceae bacterium]
MRTLASALGWSSVLALAFAACGSDPEGGGSGGTSSGGSSATGGSSTGGSAGSGGSSTGGSGTGGSGTGGSGTGGAGTGGSAGDAGIADVSFTYDGPVGDDGGIGDACAATTVKADPAPLDMFIMLDNSASMGADCTIGQATTSKWCYSINALSQFFQAAPSGTGVALQYFPKCWPSTTECTTGTSCAVAEVGLATLPGNLTALQTSLNGTTPSGGTPMEAALNGLTKFTQANKQPGRVMIGVFITDGVPEGCTTNVNVLAGIVQNHLTATGIKSFVIGMDGADFGKLDSIAAPGGASPHTQYCGGSSPCYSYDVDNGNPAAFTAVLAAIQKSAVACQYSMPTTDGGIVDLNKVEVQYFPGGNPPAQKLTKVTSSAACTGAGWFFDNNANPKSILLCPGSCSVVQLDSKAKVDVNLGCLGS